VYLLCLPSTEDFPEFSYTQHKHFYVAGKYEGGQAFVRPSGMEDVVCMHADASSQQSVDALAHAVCVQVYHLVGGISPEP
jgi:phosphomannomutase